MEKAITTTTTAAHRCEKLACENHYNRIREKLKCAA